MCVNETWRVRLRLVQDQFASVQVFLAQVFLAQVSWRKFLGAKSLA
jgi:hypothetical protein